MELLHSAYLVHYLVCLFALLALLVAWLIHKTANRNLFHWHTYVTCFVGYYCAAGIVLLLPLDLALTVERRNIALAGNEGLERLSGTIETLYAVRSMKICV